MKHRLPALSIYSPGFYSLGFYSLCLFLCAISAQAAPLYLEQVNAGKADEKKLQQAYKQIQDHKEKPLQEALFVSAFHQQKLKLETDKKSLCHTCHQQPPHSKDERKRSFLNMHSTYISCETCHFIPEDINLEYRWLNFNQSSNTNTAERITPFYRDQAVIIFSDHELVTEIKDIWKNTSEQGSSNEESSIEELSMDKAKLKLRLHTPLSEKGPACLECHDNSDQLLDLASLGYSEKEIAELQQHAIPRFFSRFKDKEQRLRMSDLLQ